MRHLLLIAAVLCGTAAAASEHAAIGGGQFSSVLPQGPGNEPVTVAPFKLDRHPVTNAEFLAFVLKQPRWRRDRVATLFADAGYLAHWRSATDLGGDLRPQQPVTRVSWFAAKAYCESRGERLPTWYEWEYAAAASETVPDARGDPAWRQRILDWYAQPSPPVLPDVGRSPANYYGVSDLHGLIWEWVLDFNALLVSSDSREQGGADRLRFCGEGALSAADREHYAVLMRIAFLSSLEARYTTANLGFRCAQDAR
jgi:formylglycine-generating enzyme required for sulfatase activity